jgi:hypothetical protein
MYGIEAVAEKEGEKTANCSSRLQTPGSTDPWMLFLYALKAPSTKEKYIQRLTKFVDYLDYQGRTEEKARDSI